MLSATARSPRMPTAFNVPGAYGTEKVALNSSSRPVGFSPISLSFRYKRTFSAPEYTSTCTSLPSCPGQVQLGNVG